GSSFGAPVEHRGNCGLAVLSRDGHARSFCTVVLVSSEGAIRVADMPERAALIGRQ
ncbi:hypothetical protein Pmar_PMAR027892, partial [Perkinsus marinus ATCC 50983]